MSSRAKRTINSVLHEITFFTIISVLFLCISVFYFDKETIKDLECKSGRISDVEFVSEAKTKLISFKLDSTQCYYLIRDGGWAKQDELLHGFESLESSGIIVTVAFNDDKNRSIDAEYGNNVIDIRDNETTYFSIDSHNRYELFGRLFFAVISLPGLVMTIIAQYRIIHTRIKKHTKKKT